MGLTLKHRIAGRERDTDTSGRPSPSRLPMRSHADAEGIVHRDVKKADIFVT